MESAFVNWLGTPLGIFVTCLVALNVLTIVLVVKNYKLKIRAWEGELYNELLDIGFPTWAISWLQDASHGDRATALGDFQKAFKLLRTSNGFAELAGGILAKAKQDPTRWAAITKVFNDVNSGVDPTADLQAAVASSPFAKLTPAPKLLDSIKSDLHSAATDIQAKIQAGKTDLESVLSSVNSDLHPAASSATPVAVASFNAGVASVKAAVVAAAPAAVAAVAAPVAAPVAIPAAVIAATTAAVAA